MISRIAIFVWCLAFLSMAVAFVPTQTHAPSPLVQRGTMRTTRGAVASPLSSNRFGNVAVSVPNPFKLLPWNVERELKRSARSLKLERSRLHRELGIPEDASYEQIVEATDVLIARAGGDVKRKVQIEVTKDKILQIRLNERLKGLASVDKDARAQSTFEVEGGEDELETAVKQAAAQWSAPKWTQGLIVKPDEKHRNGQIRLWGIITMMGLGIPPAQDYLNRFTWLVCIAQLTFRGMPREDVGGGGFAMSFNAGGGGKGHRKVAFFLGVTTWILGSILIYALMPAWAKGKRYTGSIAFTMRNLIFGVVSCYLQPYKG